MGKMGFFRAAVVAATVSGAFVVSAGHVAAAGTVHTRSSSLTAYAHLVGESDGVSTWTDVAVSLTDAATMTARLDYMQWVVVSEDEGVIISNLAAIGGGDVHLVVGSRLSSATLSGTITVTPCPDWACSADNAVVVPVEGTWTATSEPIRARTRTIVSGSKTSRQMVAQTATYRYADASVLVDGVSLGAVDFPLDATIADARSSSVDFYFGASADLPGRLVSGGVTPSMVADPRQRYTGFFESADATWSESDGQSTRDASFSVGFQRTESRGTLVNGVLAQYYDNFYVTDEFGNSIPVGSTYGWTDGGSFAIGARLRTASYVGTIPLQTCISIDWGEQVCGDPVDVAFDIAWTSTGPTTRTLYNQSYTGWDGGFHTSHSVWEMAPAAATGTMGGVAIGTPATGSMVQIHDTHDGSAV